MAKQKWYVVTVGKQVGVFDDWLIAAPLVSEVPGSLHKSYPSQDKAIRAFENAKASGNVRVEPSTTASSAPSTSSRTPAAPANASQNVSPHSPSQPPSSLIPQRPSTSTSPARSNSVMQHTDVSSADSSPSGTQKARRHRTESSLFTPRTGQTHVVSGIPPLRGTSPERVSTVYSRTSSVRSKLTPRISPPLTSLESSPDTAVTQYVKGHDSPPPRQHLSLRTVSTTRPSQPSSPSMSRGRKMCISGYPVSFSGLNSTHVRVVYNTSPGTKSNSDQPKTTHTGWSSRSSEKSANKDSVSFPVSAKRLYPTLSDAILSPPQSLRTSARPASLSSIQGSPHTETSRHIAAPLKESAIELASSEVSNGGRWAAQYPPRVTVGTPSDLESLPDSSDSDSDVEEQCPLTADASELLSPLNSSFLRFSDPVVSPISTKSIESVKSSPFQSSARMRAPKARDDGPVSAVTSSPSSRRSVTGEGSPADFFATLGLSQPTQIPSVIHDAQLDPRSPMSRRVPIAGGTNSSSFSRPSPLMKIDGTKKDLFI